MFQVACGGQQFGTPAQGLPGIWTKSVADSGHEGKTITSREPNNSSRSKENSLLFARLPCANTPNCPLPRQGQNGRLVRLCLVHSCTRTELSDRNREASGPKTGV